MSDEALKPCPFCGEQCATLVIDQGDKWAHYEPSCLEVRTGYDLSDDAAWRAEAITAWNTRADAKTTEARQVLDCLVEIKTTIQNSGHWWMDCPDRGGFDLEQIETAIAALQETGRAAQTGVKPQA